MWIFKRMSALSVELKSYDETFRKRNHQRRIGGRPGPRLDVTVRTGSGEEGDKDLNKEKNKIFYKFSGMFL